MSSAPKYSLEENMTGLLVGLSILNVFIWFEPRDYKLGNKTEVSCLLNILGISTKKQNEQ